MESAPTGSVIKSKIGRGYPSADICKEYSLAIVNQMGQNQN